jgi:phytoene dehydrogenase-like protein
MTRNKYKLDSGAHIIGGIDNNEILSKIFKKLNINNVEFLRINPTDRITFPDDIIEIPTDLDVFMHNLECQFKNESRTIKKFFNDIFEIANPFLINSAIRKFGKYTYQELVDMYFRDKRLKAILSVQCGYLGLPPNKASAVSTIFMLKSYLKGGAFYSKGGAQKLPDAIADKYCSYGGNLLLSTKVTKILLKNGVAYGVICSNGDTIESKSVVSNADCRRTFLNLINSNDEWPNKKRTFKILNNSKLSISYFILYLAVKAKTDKLLKKSGWHFASYDINKDFNNQLYIHIPTIIDSHSINEETHIIEAGMVSSYVKNASNWNIIKSQMSNEILNRIMKICNIREEDILFKEAATPNTIERYTLNTGGASYGWEQTPRQVFHNTFPQVTPIKNLFLAGHWTSPGGGIVSVAISGFLTAQKILREYGAILNLKT